MAKVERSGSELGNHIKEIPFETLAKTLFKPPRRRTRKKLTFLTPKNWANKLERTRWHTHTLILNFAALAISLSGAACLFSLLLFAGAKVLIFIINYETFAKKAQNLKNEKEGDRQKESGLCKADV